MNTTGSYWNDLIGLRALFYMVPPSEAVADVRDVPNYTGHALPWFYCLVIIDIITGFARGKLRFDPRDTVGSLSAASMSVMTGLLGHRAVEMAVYIPLYNKFHLFDLDYSAYWLYLVTALCYDLGYYVTHRTGHEINLFWAAHQTHHSSEYYNLSTALRQSMWHKYTTFPVYLPLAFLGVPPSIFLLHRELNKLYQFWIHTSQVQKLWWPLEFILNTPSHHRVHHGRNEYCIDKNYAAVLIIWDRMCGTFAEEKENEEIAFGLVEPIKTYNPITIQCKYFGDIFTYLRDSEKSARQKIQKIFCGPGWNIEEQKEYSIPELTEENRKPWNVKNDSFLNFYVYVQLFIQTVFFVKLYGKVHHFGFFYSILGYFTFAKLLVPQDHMMGLTLEIVRQLIGATHFAKYEEILPDKITTIFSTTAFISLSTISLYVVARLFTRGSRSKEE